MFTMIRLGFGAYMHCPAGDHWALVRRTKETELTPHELQTLELRERLDDRDVVKLNSSIGLLEGVVTLGITVVVHNWWGIAGSVVWVMLWGAVFIHASRNDRLAAAPK